MMRGVGFSGEVSGGYRVESLRLIFSSKDSGRALFVRPWAAVYVCWSPVCFDCHERMFDMGTLGDCWLMLSADSCIVIWIVCQMVVIMEVGVVRSSGIMGRRVCEGCPDVAETGRAVVEVWSRAYEKWCAWGMRELRFICETSATRGFCSADMGTGSQSVSGYFSHSRATHITQYR